MKFTVNTFAIFLLLIQMSCDSSNSTQDGSGSRLEQMDQQLSRLREVATKNQRIPRTVHEGKIKFTGQHFDWTEGFFPGTCWYMYEMTGDDAWKQSAENLQNLIVEHRFLTTNHDLGFVFNCSFGNGWRLTKNQEFKNVLVDASNSLITRFDPTIGSIKSWDVDRGWQSERGWQYPVIIDNMMNLELLFEASNLSGDNKYRELAITHANTTLKHHYRQDGSSYHVVDYDTITGQPRNKHTAQGYAHESAWARGQAWGLYGYTVSFRYTKDERYLKQAERIADFILNHPNLPEDKVPYWDFNAPNIPDELRDASAGAIIGSALLELDNYSSKNYKDAASTIISSLSSDKYFASVGDNHDFLLMHSVGSIPHGAEIDVPLNYADYYYTEAIYRLAKK